MFSANILKNRNTPFFEKTKPKKNTTNWKWPSRYPPSDTAKLLAIFVWNPPALCISSAIYPERKPVRVSSDLCYQPLTRPYRSHVTVPQVHHLSRGPAGGGVTPSPGEPRHLCSPSSPPASVTSTLAHDGSFSTPELPRTSSFPLKSLAVDGRRALTSQVGAFDMKKGFQLNYYLLKEENPRRGSGTLDGAATPWRAVVV